MSRRHFAIEERKGRYHIEDQESSNGTWVNGERTAAAELKDNDRILAGHTWFVFQSGLGTMIRSLAEEPRSYATEMRKIIPDAKPQRPG